MAAGEGLTLVLQFLAVAVAAGLLGTAAMTAFMQAITSNGICNADMVRAIGSIFTGSYESSRLVGGVLHFISGVLFGILYTLLFNFFELSSFMQHVHFGMFFGTAHGFVVTMLLVVTVAEHHPLEQFRKVGPGVAAAHLVGHVLFGLVVGVVVAASGLRLF